MHDDCFYNLLRLYGTIPDGTLSDFDFITNNYLSDYRYDSRNFFEYRDEVINFFSTYTTHDSLQALQNPKP